MSDYTLYGGTPPYERTSQTSALAASGIRRYSGSLRMRVLAWVTARGVDGATSDEIEEGTGLLHQTASARARELVLLGELVDSGMTRKTRSGVKAAVLVAKVYSVPRQTALFGDAA